MEIRVVKYNGYKNEKTAKVANIEEMEANKVEYIVTDDGDGFYAVYAKNGNVEHYDEDTTDVFTHEFSLDGNDFYLEAVNAEYVVVFNKDGFHNYDENAWCEEQYTKAMLEMLDGKKAEYISEHALDNLEVWREKISNGENPSDWF